MGNRLAANNVGFYFDYQNGEYGYNTSPLRGADTFSPFKKGNPDSFYTPYIKTYSNNNAKISYFKMGDILDDLSEYTNYGINNGYINCFTNDGNHSGQAWDNYSLSVNGDILIMTITNRTFLSSYTGTVVQFLLSKSNNSVTTQPLNPVFSGSGYIYTCTFDSKYIGYSKVGLLSCANFGAYTSNNSGTYGASISSLTIDSSTGIITMVISGNHFLKNYPPSGFVFTLAK